MLVFSLFAVNAQGDQDLDIAVGDALAVEPLHQQGEVDLAAGVARDVGGDDNHPLSRFER